MKKTVSNALSDLIHDDQLEQLDTNLFRGYGTEGHVGRIYGGHVMAQAIRAAQQSVDEHYSLHSFHSYFLRPGDPSRAVIYDVDPIRDGRSFLTRRIVARQRGRAIFNCSMSFQVKENGLEHQATMPTVLPPEELASEAELAKAVNRGVGRSWPIEFRQVDPMDYANPKPKDPVVHTWFKTADPIDDDLRLHQQLLAYASDMPILITALRPHGVTQYTPEIMTATIDHALWFHRPFRVDEWLLYEIHSDSVGGGRGISRGKIFSRDGALVASVIQEGLARIRR